MEISDIQQAKAETRAAMHEWTTAVFKVRKLVAAMEFSRYGSYAYAASVIEALVCVEDRTVRALLRLSILIAQIERTNNETYNQHEKRGDSGHAGVQIEGRDGVLFAVRSDANLQRREE